MNELLQQLSEAQGVSGAEKEVRSLIQAQISDHVDRIEVDSMGNLLAWKKGTGEQSLKVMVDAHIDEIGLLVTEVDALGAAKFMKVGGINDRNLAGKTVQVGPEKITGVIGLKPVHLLKKQAEYQKVVAADSMRIDIGARGKDAGNAKMKIGDRATFLTAYEEQGCIAFGKAFDNRCGCAILINLLQGDSLPVDLVAVFSVQEEIGLRGAKVASYHIQPDLALVLEATPAYDLPTGKDSSPNVALGQGVAIYVMDNITIQDPRLVAHIMKIASENDIPYQIRQPGGGGTNTGAIQRSHVGVPAATIAVPVRYAHSPISLINLDDFENAGKLTFTFLNSLTPAVFNRE